MAITGIPVTIASNGLGIPVVDSVNGPLATTCNFGMPVVVATNGYGIPLNLGGAAGGWTPAQLTGLIGWYDATVGVTQAAGVVTTWADQSGAGNNLTQATTANKPTYSATSFNGRQGITFDGTNDYLASAVGAIAHGGGNKLSCFMAATEVSIKTDGRWVTYYAGSSGNDYDQVLSAIASAYGAASNFFGLRNSAPLDGQTISVATPYRLGFVFDGTNHTVFVNNSSDGTPVASTGNFGTPGRLFVGCGYVSSAVGSYSNICIAEIILTNTALTATDRTNIDNYLFTKWWGAAARYLVNKDNGYIVNKDSAYITT